MFTIKRFFSLILLVLLALLSVPSFAKIAVNIVLYGIDDQGERHHLPAKICNNPGVSLRLEAVQVDARNGQALPQRHRYYRWTAIDSNSQEYKMTTGVTPFDSSRDSYDNYYNKCTMTPLHFETAIDRGHITHVQTTGRGFAGIVKVEALLADKKASIELVDPRVSSDCEWAYPEMYLSREMSWPAVGCGTMNNPGNGGGNGGIDAAPCNGHIVIGAMCSDFCPPAALCIGHEGGIWEIVGWKPQ